MPTNPTNPNKESKTAIGQFDANFVPFSVASVDGVMHSINELPPPSPELSGVAPVQRSGQAYIQWESDTLYNHNTGVLQLPLSQPRQDPEIRQRLGVSSSTDDARCAQSSVSVRLCAPSCKRVLKIIASREGAWPTIPAPMARYIDQVTGIAETLIDEAPIVFDEPKLMQDGVTMRYSVQMRWVYALSRPPAMKMFTEGSFAFAGPIPTGSQTPNNEYNEYYRMSSSPTDKTTPWKNGMPIRFWYDIFHQIDGMAPPPPTP